MESDELDSTATPLLRPGRLAFFALMLAACIVLPFTSDMPLSPLSLIIGWMRSSIAAGLVACATVGAPHGFAIAVVLAARGGKRPARIAVRAWTYLVQGALVLLSLQVWSLDRHGAGFVAPLALYGFTLVTVIRYRMDHVVGMAGLRRDVRHGALAIVGALAWLELQVHAGELAGVAWWLHGTLTSAVLVFRAARPRR